MFLIRLRGFLGKMKLVGTSFEKSDLLYLTNFNLFPNPTQDKIQLQIDQMTSAGVTVEIINTQGQILAKKRVFDALTEWSIAQFSGNIFFVTVMDETSSTTKKLIVSSKLK